MLRGGAEEPRGGDREVERQSCARSAGRRRGEHLGLDDVIVGVDYGADLERARQVILTALTPLDGLDAEPAPLVLVHELAASSVNLKVRFWVNSRQRSYLDVTSAATQAIKAVTGKVIKT